MKKTDIAPSIVLRTAEVLDQVEAAVLGDDQAGRGRRALQMRDAVAADELRDRRSRADGRRHGAQDARAGRLSRTASSSTPKSMRQAASSTPMAPRSASIERQRSTSPISAFAEA